MNTILDDIVRKKREEIASARAARPIAELEAVLRDAPAPRDFLASLQSAPTIGLIAEVKKASPSAGLIREDFDPVAIASTYAEHGASCISVLTDETFFQGHLDFLKAVRKAVEVPVLRKDFVLDRYQVVEARAAGADAVLLIAECLTDDALRSLYETICELGMHALVELYDLENLDRVLALDAPLVGINNRDLRTFVTDLEHSIALASKLPEGTLLVSESGIRTHNEVRRLQEAGCGAILVGETLMRADDIGAAVDELLGKS
ncbi:indole-3-glycerol phosphate synthase TrpC [Stratiformator vulcanicus]|uniref:Indole-3-glycerol phosphate synthase n=1 Tax=Stratiformator vulcanicus TaxID=2527980 RepID=A0A517R3J2_9PLAN|nr:indole-3-glycerol phosphate synthase TrpC [Stratiformator vulcanicus]QDT38427.1 Indole-3-glycerol phosphate synthase [Stratiformator vulcanicus]